LANVFISYRRTDTAGYADWINAELKGRFGPDRVFMDMDSVPLGVDFVEHLKQTIEATDVALILIGRGWLSAADDTGGRRLDDPEDIVRIEVAIALRSSSRVIPVLFDSAPMPKSAELPDDLQLLTRRQGLLFQRPGGASIDQIAAAIDEVTDAAETGKIDTTGDFRAVALGFDAGDVRTREATARQIKRMAPLLTVAQVLDLSQSRAVAERVAAAIALGVHLGDPNDARRDRRIELALLSDPASSLIRYRAAQAFRNSPAFVPAYESELRTLAESDENSYVREMATNALNAAGGPNGPR
jgi:TIR domain